MKVTRSEVYAAIDSERDFQIALVDAAHDDPAEPLKSLESFNTYIAHYQQELNKTLSTVWGPECYEKALPIIRKIAALSVAAMERFGAPEREWTYEDIAARVPGFVPPSATPADPFDDVPF